MDFNPRSPCGERRYVTARQLEAELISTHAPRAGSDPVGYGSQVKHRYFNPRSPCGERLDAILPGMSAVRFQPTLPVRGATGLAMRGHLTIVISTHAPRTGSVG